MANTSNYNWQKPDVGGSSGTWGTTLNTDLDSIDSQVKTVSDAAAAAQTDADAAQTDATSALSALKAIAPQTVTLTGGDPYAGTIDLALGATVYRVTVSSGFTTTDCNLTFTNRPATTGKFVYVHFVVTQGSGDTFTVKVVSGSKQWALMLRDTVSTSGTQTVVSFTGSQQVILPFYIAGS